MAANVSTVIAPNVLIGNYVHGARSMEAWRQVQKVVSEQIKHNFETTLPEVRTVVLDSDPVSIPKAFIIHLTSIIPNFLLLAGCLYGVNELASDRVVIHDAIDILIALLAIFPITYLAASIYQAVVNTHRTFYRIVSSPLSLYIPLEQIVNAKDEKTGRFINHLTLELFPENITAPRHFLIEKRVVDLPYALFYMLTKKPEENEIPSPYHNGFLSHEDKKKFLADLSNFTSIPPESLEKCWQQIVSDQVVLNLMEAMQSSEAFQQLLSEKLARARAENIEIDEQHLRIGLLAFLVIEYFKTRTPNIRMTYFLNLLPKESRAYFTLKA